ncbi:MAG: MBL fold metallo-hydrolase [Candidatus Azobacteroides sp.]|nr:MBL fold metallo-hydrolase [Candidatus Azobacteroides sp.]
MNRNLLIFLPFLFFFSLFLQANEKEEKLIFTYKAGDITITLLSEMQREGTSDILIGASEEIIAKEIPSGVYPSAVNVFLVETPDKTILIDAGFGIKLFDNLHSIGKNIEDIDIILLTHMHGDHIGGLLRDGEKSFPNAALYIPRKEYSYWTSKEEMEKVTENKRSGFLNAQKTIESYQDKLQLFDPEEAGSAATELFPGITPLAAYGHTPGHTGYLLESNGNTLFIWGDLVNCMPIQVPYPQIATVHDIDPLQASITREKLFHYLLTNNIRIAGMHIEYPAMGELRLIDGKYRFDIFQEK